MRSIKSILGDRETITVERRATVTDAARLMADRHIGAVPVVDEGRLVGIFSERDVLTRIVAAWLRVTDGVRRVVRLRLIGPNGRVLEEVAVPPSGLPRWNVDRSTIELTPQGIAS